MSLERPLRFGAPLGGHLVLGRVDSVGTVKDATRVESTGAGPRLGSWRVGQPVNIEADVTGKYLRRSLEIRGRP